MAGPAAAGEYVALGDSYSSGNGTYNPNLNIFCYRSTDAYPYIVSKQTGHSLKFAACGGATTTDVLNSQVGSLSSRTAYVTITVGGNDIGFGDMMMECPKDGETQACYDAINSARTKIDSTLPGALDKTYAEIKRRSSKAKALVLGYGIYIKQLCTAIGGITQGEADGLNDVANRLDAKTAERVRAVGSSLFSYDSAIQPWTGHDPCSSTPWIRGYDNNLLNDFHPNKAGHMDGYVPMVRRVIK